MYKFSKLFNNIKDKKESNNNVSISIFFYEFLAKSRLDYD